ncbi:hypothetical protein PVK06_011647 [Gossypium arboreum]|uniref:DUF4283 domain-containing protein n=1 Tax=Gossypium arboreum TaxID=29729 RepID=A0ABR0Q9C2_GOSAR|nr:hypothetical protein PVK06_011647 [Gossypium arboreum]
MVTEIELANVNFADEEEELIQFDKDSYVVEEDNRFCLVGKTLIDCVVRFPSLKKTLVDLWHPLGGVSITDIGEKRYFFRFFYKVDNKRVMDGMP